ncbi:MAG TPA: glycosyltransferase [Gemmataceae bacterium]|nr:glycosyltransferase [Gemmataceae bacterium]
MKIAVITPFYQTPENWLEKCLASVARQTLACTHFLVCDGDEPKLSTAPEQVQVLRLPQAHQDFGNTPRAIGSVSAISQGFDAIAYLDSDNWYEPDHLQLLWEAHQRTRAAVCSSSRNLFDLEGSLLGACPEVDGEHFVDTNCLFLTRDAFAFVAAWYLMPRTRVEVGDRYVWQAIRKAGVSRHHVPQATVNYRTRHQAHYRHFGMTPPPQAKQIKIMSHMAHLPDAMPANNNRQRTSLCMIVRNEQDKLGRCLQSAGDLVDEIIVVDTGSTDATKQVAAGCGAKVFDFPWVDDFGAARNESLHHASGDWIFWLDADEWLDEPNRQKLRRLFAALPDQNRVYMMKQWSASEAANGSALVVEQARLFRKQPGVCWRQRIHEQILLALREAGAKVVWTDIVIGHRGYQGAAQRKQKLNRNLRLLQMEHREQPDNPFTLFNLAGTLHDLGQGDRTVSYLRRCLETAPRRATFLPKVFVLLARAAKRDGSFAEAIRICRDGKARFPKDAELWFEEGLLCKEAGDVRAAIQCFEQIIKLPPRPCYVGVDMGIRGHLPHHHLALIHTEQGREAEAEHHWRAATAHSPRFKPAWLGLAKLFLRQRRLHEVESIAERLHGDPAEPHIRKALHKHAFTVASSG